MPNARQVVEPSRREFFGGLAVLTMLGCILVTRDGRPPSTWAGMPDATLPMASKQLFDDSGHTSPDAAKLADQEQPQVHLVAEVANSSP